MQPAILFFLSMQKNCLCACLYATQWHCNLFRQFFVRATKEITFMQHFFNANPTLSHTSETSILPFTHTRPSTNVCMYVSGTCSMLLCYNFFYIRCNFKSHLIRSNDCSFPVRKLRPLAQAKPTAYITVRLPLFATTLVCSPSRVPSNRLSTCVACVHNMRTGRGRAGRHECKY